MATILHLIAVVAFTCQLSSALYFHIAETERKCFIEEIPDETMVTGLFCSFFFSSNGISDFLFSFAFSGNYKVQLYDPQTKGYADYPGIGMHVEVKDPDDNVRLLIDWLID